MEILVTPNFIAPRMCDEGACVCTAYCPNYSCSCDVDDGDDGDKDWCKCLGIYIDL